MRTTPAPTLAFEVDDLPPIRTEAISMLTAGHRQTERVRALLAAAEAAVRQSGWTPLTGPVALGVVLHCPPRRRNVEVATLLAGIGAVLQQRKRVVNIGLGHLGLLGEVAVYLDERQLSQLSYRELPAERFSYSVRVTAVPGPV